MKRSLLICLAMMTALVVAAPGSAHNKTWTDTLTATKQTMPGSNPPTAVYSGTLSSPNPACVAGREISISGVGAGGSFVPVATAITDASGNWKTSPAPVPPNGQDAISVTKILKKKTVRKKGKRKKQSHVCFSSGNVNVP